MRVLENKPNLISNPCKESRATAQVGLDPQAAPRTAAVNYC